MATCVCAPEICEILPAFGADADARNSDGFTPARVYAERHGTPPPIDAFVVSKPICQEALIEEKENVLYRLSRRSVTVYIDLSKSDRNR
jgi:hypothetical protein